MDLKEIVSKFCEGNKSVEMASFENEGTRVCVGAEITKITAYKGAFGIKVVATINGKEKPLYSLSIKELMVVALMAKMRSI